MNTNVGLLGGTFNPIHHGHIRLGLTVRDAFNLERILYILSARPPHKKNDDLAAAEIRWKMLTHALKPFSSLLPCDIEMNRPHDSWTIDTVEQLMQSNPQHRYFFISGSEGFLKIKTWKNYKQLLRMISFIVILRHEDHKPRVMQLLEEENIDSSDGFCPDESSLEPLEPRVYLFTYRSDTLDISSTRIRQSVKESQNIDHFVDSEVKKIMEEFKLYEK